LQIFGLGGLAKYGLYPASTRECLVRQKGYAPRVDRGRRRRAGFQPDNARRKTGDMNLYLDSTAYGYVEIGHLALCHAILDYSMAWAEGSRAVARA
jgi:hypothetical protein